MPKEVQILQKLGLNLTQAKVYITLCKYGTLNTKKIANFSSVSRPDVYRILETLEAMGLIEKTISKPFRYKILPSDERLSALLERKKKDTIKLESEVQVLLKSLQKKSNFQNLENDFQTVIISGRKTLLLRTKKIVEEAQKSLCCLGSYKKISLGLFSLAEEIKQSMDRGVNLQIVTEENEGSDLTPNMLLEYTKSTKSKETPISIRYVKKLETHILVVDRKQVLINTSTQTGLAESPAVWSNNPCIVALSQNHFDIKWLIASKDQTLKID